MAEAQPSKPPVEKKQKLVKREEQPKPLPKKKAKERDLGYEM
jgi:hypothetical protein